MEILVRGRLHTLKIPGTAGTQAKLGGTQPFFLAMVCLGTFDFSVGRTFSPLQNRHF